MDNFKELMDKLSPREEQICRVIQAHPGVTKRGIGTQLGISHHTVDTYLRRVYAKAGVDNRCELVARIVKSSPNQV